MVPGVPYKLKRHPEADPAEASAQTPRRPAAPALAGMVRAVIRGAGVPPVMGPSPVALVRVVRGARKR